MNDDSMREALKRRKLGALDITILLGDNAGVLPQGDVNEQADMEDDVDSEALDLAPKGSDVGEVTSQENMDLSHGDVDQDKMMLEQELAKMGMGKGTMLKRQMGKRTQSLGTTEV